MIEYLGMEHTVDLDGVDVEHDPVRVNVWANSTFHIGRIAIRNKTDEPRVVVVYPPSRDPSKNKI